MSNFVSEPMKLCHEEERLLIYFKFKILFLFIEHDDTVRNQKFFSTAARESTKNVIPKCSSATAYLVYEVNVASDVFAVLF